MRVLFTNAIMAIAPQFFGRVKIKIFIIMPTDLPGIDQPLRVLLIYRAAVTNVLLKLRLKKNRNG